MPTVVGARISLGGDRSVRPLDAIRISASTSRVLNLLAVAENRNRDDLAYVAHPFFANPILNESIVLKHKLRQNEQFAFDYPRGVATKIILPFERKDLRLGGQSFFVGQRGWRSLLEELTEDREATYRDAVLLQEIDELPSLDPFLLKEHLGRRGYSIAPAYFAISDADIQRMLTYVGKQIGELLELAFERNNLANNQNLMAGVLLSTNMDERLEPLRVVMRLEKSSYSEGIFTWKGFLYYKWSLQELSQNLENVLSEITSLKTSTHVDNGQSKMITAEKMLLIRNIQNRRMEVQKVLQVYDDAYLDLTRNNQPIAFRNFLMSAPGMFAALGEKIGGLSHVISWWRYRFPSGRKQTATTAEIIDLLSEFNANLETFQGVTPEAPDWLKEPGSLESPEDAPRNLPRMPMAVE